jgi:hypothetical protein
MLYILDLSFPGVQKIADVNGKVKEKSAMDLVMRLIQEITPEKTREGIIELVRGFNSEGMTAAKDQGIGLKI